LTGIDGDGLLAVHGGADFPAVKLVRDIGPVEDDPRTHFRITYASFPIGRGRLLVERDSATATFRSSVPLADDEVIHPWLSRVAGMFGHWLGREVLHGGAFTAGDGAWAVIGASEAGKSTLLAGLVGAGLDVLTDDVLVIDERLVCAGPRCIDVRPEAAVAIGADDAPAGRGGTRRRLRLPPAPATVPLAGIVHLRWGERVEIARLPLADRIEMLRAAAWLGPMDPIGKRALLDMASLPTVELVRPRRLEHIHESVTMLVSAVSA
jgi:hypothetical protein